MKKSLANNIILLIVLSFVLKGVGFINRMIIAYYFGTSFYTDVFYNASGFMDSISAILLASISVGVINVYISNKGTGRNNKFVTDLLLICFSLMLIISFGLFCFAEQISLILAPGYSKESSDIFVKMIKIMSVTLPFQGGIAVYSAVLQAEEKFTPVKLIGTVTSVVSIICVICLANIIGINSLIISYVIGIVLNTIILGFNSRNLFKPDISFKQNPDIQRVIHMIGPLLLGIAAHEINLVVDKSIASGIESGAVSALSYSCVLYLFVENIIINSIVTAFFPNLRQKVLDKNEANVAVDTQKVFALAEVLLVPMVIVAFVFSEPIVRIIYMRGNFDHNSLQLTCAALRGYVLGLPFLALRDISMQVFYAYGDTITPVKVNIFAVVINVLLDVVLSKWFGIFGITAATSVASLLSGLILFYILCQKNNMILNSSFKKYCLIQVLVTILLVFIINFSNMIWNSFFMVPLVFLVSMVIQLAIMKKSNIDIIVSVLDYVKYKFYKKR